MNEDLTMFRWEGENRLWDKIHAVLDENIRSLCKGPLDSSLYDEITSRVKTILEAPESRKP